MSNTNDNAVESYAVPKSWLRVMGVTVMCRPKSADMSKLFVDQMKDWLVTRLGTSGFEFQCGDPLDIGEALSVSLHLPDTRNFVIANAVVSAVQPEGDLTRVAATFTELPPPLQRRITTIMHKFGAAETQETDAGPPPLADERVDQDFVTELQGRMNELNVNMDVYLDILDLFAAGINLDDFTPADHPESALASAEPEDESRMPMFELSPSGILKLNAAGEPAGHPVDYLKVPGSDARVCFGCKCTSRIDLGHGLISNPGSIFVFSYEDFPEDNNIILCPMGSEAILGRAYVLNKGTRVVLEPSDASEPPVVLDCAIHDAGYKLVARYEYF